MTRSPEPQDPRSRDRALGRVRHAAIAIVTAISVTAPLAGCVTDVSDQAVPPTQTGPDGPACRAGSVVTGRLGDGIGSDPAAVQVALEDFADELPAELRGFIEMLLSPDDVEAPDGSSGYTTAWRVLDTWSIAVCERPLLPASFEQPDLSWIAEEEWRRAGSDEPVSASRADEAPPGGPVAAREVEGPPPSFEDLVLVLATQSDGDVPWYTDDVTGMIGRSAVGTSISVEGVATAALALAACDQLAAAAGEGPGTDIVVRGIDGELLALTDQDGCRTARGT